MSVYTITIICTSADDDDISNTTQMVIGMGMVTAMFTIGTVYAV
nr:hypothetical protein [Vibrio parahaemolyticus]